MQGVLEGLRPCLVVTPSPVSPSPWQGEGEELERGAAPLLDAPLGGGEDKGGFKGGEASLPYSPQYEGQHGESLRGAVAPLPNLPLSFEGEGD